MTMDLNVLFLKETVKNNFFWKDKNPAGYHCNFDQGILAKALFREQQI